VTGLSEALDATRVEETRRAARALLRRPLLRAAGAEADEFTLVRKHIGALRAWFDRNTGWRLLVDSAVARLVKAAADTADSTYPARDLRTRMPFGRRRYVLTCLALAALERADAQITLGQLAEQVVLGVLDPELVEAGVVFTLDNREERGDLVAVVRLLLDLGVLSRVAGDEESFVKNSGDVLYDVERRVLASLLATPRGPSTVDERDFEARLAAVTQELEPTTDELRNRALRHRLTRMLLEAPVLYFDELDDAELAYLTSQRAAITARISELTGLVAEVRAEGIAMVDPSDDLTDVRMPDSGTDGHVTLLLAEFLAARDGELVDEAELRAQVRLFADQHRSFWRRTATEPGAETELTALALTRLEALRLIRREGGAVAGRPALARYAVTEPVIQDPKGSDS
jgi:uncharacterized protein (TIGR02678 family)